MGALVFVLLMFLVSVATILTIDNWLTGCISGGSLLAILAAGLLLSWWHGRRAHRTQKKKELRARLARVLRCDRGEALREVMWLVVSMLLVGAAVALVLGILPTSCAAAEPVHIDEVLIETSDELFPAVPLRGVELANIQAAGLQLYLLGGMLNDAHTKMAPDTREQRARARRLLEKAFEAVVEIQVLHVGAVIQATRKPGKGGAK